MVVIQRGHRDSYVSNFSGWPKNWFQTRFLTNWLESWIETASKNYAMIKINVLYIPYSWFRMHHMSADGIIVCLVHFIWIIIMFLHFYIYLHSCMQTLLEFQNYSGTCWDTMVGCHGGNFLDTHPILYFLNKNHFNYNQTAFWFHTKTTITYKL